jgi:hypothetical protein
VQGKGFEPYVTFFLLEIYENRWFLSYDPRIMSWWNTDGITWHNIEFVSVFNDDVQLS